MVRKPKIVQAAWPFPVVGPLSKKSKAMIYPPTPVKSVVEAILRHRKAKNGKTAND